MPAWSPPSRADRVPVSTRDGLCLSPNSPAAWLPPGEFPLTNAPLKVLLGHSRPAQNRASVPDPAQTGRPGREVSRRGFESPMDSQATGRTAAWCLRAAWNRPSFSVRKSSGKTQINRMMTRYECASSGIWSASMGADRSTKYDLIPFSSTLPRFFPGRESETWNRRATGPRSIAEDVATHAAPAPSTRSPGVLLLQGAVHVKLVVGTAQQVPTPHAEWLAAADRPGP